MSPSPVKRRVGLVVLPLSLSLLAASPALAAAPQYTFMQVDSQTHKPVRWDPCQTIGYMVNTVVAPRGALGDVQGALARISQATGLKFRYLGSTRHIPQTAEYQGGPTRAVAPLVISWARPQGSSTTWTSDILPNWSGLAGMGGFIASWGYDGNGGYTPEHITAGYAVLSAAFNNQLRAGFGSGQTEGELLLHELGHAMGLNHVQDPSQIMYPSMQYRKVAAYGTGDRAGLALLGAKQGCIAPPAPAKPTPPTAPGTPDPVAPPTTTG